MKVQHILLFLSLTVISLKALEYNVTLTYEFRRISGLTYCSKETLEKWDCGVACDLYKDQLVFLYHFVDPWIPGGASYSLFYDKVNNFLISAFRATDGTAQLLDEIAEGGPQEYKLHQIEGALVMSYFYDVYVNRLRDDFIPKFTEAVQNYSNSTFVFTGESLGAALTTHAILDAVLEGLVPANQTLLYNYGSPRVGNYAFASYFVNLIPNIFRVVHYKDIVPHVPPCWFFDNNRTCAMGNDVLETEKEDSDGLKVVPSYLWHAWHIWTNIFYTQENSTEYIVCNGGEDPKCADQYDILQTNGADHVNYLGITGNCEQSVGTIPGL